MNEFYALAREFDEDRFAFEMEVVSTKLNVLEYCSLLGKSKKSERIVTICKSVRLNVRYHMVDFKQLS